MGQPWKSSAACDKEDVQNLYKYRFNTKCCRTSVVNICFALKDVYLNTKAALLGPSHFIGWMFDDIDWSGSLAELTGQESPILCKGV
eukprot:5478966-Amphidinium_carterae.1